MYALEWITIQIENWKAGERDRGLEETTWTKLKGSGRGNIEDRRKFRDNIKFKEKEYESVASEWC